MPEAQPTVARTAVLAHLLQDVDARSVHALRQRLAAIVRDSGIGRSDLSRDAAVRLTETCSPAAAKKAGNAGTAEGVAEARTVASAVAMPAG